MHAMATPIATARTELLSDAALRVSTIEAPALEVVVIEGLDAGRIATLHGDGEIVIGTGAACDLVLSDERVSRRHLAVRRRRDAIEAEDLGSRNGTRLAGSKLVRGEVLLGASLVIGKTTVRVTSAAQAVTLAPSQSRRFGALVGESLAMREVFAMLERLAESDVTVLLEGETGVGKELAARAIHDASARARAPFVAIDVSALPDSLVESELFGHAKGAFTGATSARKGAFVQAHGGTLLLDELATIPSSVQARLVRVLEERRVRPVGADDEKKIDVRVIAASRTPIARLVAEGVFRADLAYRLSVVTVSIPPLRERREDLRPTIEAILRARGTTLALSQRTLDRLAAHDWPGNARELRNVLDRALALAPKATRLDELPLPPLGTGSTDGALAVRADLPFSEAKQRVVDAFERRYLEDLLSRTHGNLSEAARQASLDRKHLRELCEKHGVRRG
jgi:DNA-binding NtrC family response regulator